MEKSRVQCVIELGGLFREVGCMLLLFTLVIYGVVKVGVLGLFT